MLFCLTQPANGDSIIARHSSSIEVHPTKVQECRWLVPPRSLTVRRHGILLLISLRRKKSLDGRY
jgi:hypothetical protein